MFMLIPFIILFLFCIFIVSIEDTSGKSLWQVRGHCKCGWSVDAPFGDPNWFTLRSGVCPSCGETRRNLMVHTSRWNKDKWEYK